MADDGMLLNFAVPSEFVAPEAKIKGGTWRDRLSVKKIAAHRAQNPQRNGAGGSGDKEGGASSGSSNPNRIQVSGVRPAKRQRTDGEFQGRENNGSGSGSGAGGRQPGKPRKEQGQFVSSLFSKNPRARNAPEVKEKEKDGEVVEDAKPTNAPLIDGLDTFTNLGLSATLGAHLLTKLELKAPTAIQKASISQLLKEETDAFIQAETGSGKTLAYLLPLVQRIMDLSRAKKEGDERGDMNVQRDSGLFAIILAPTRELCKQISVVLEGLLRCAHWIVAGTVIGGEKKKSEKARLRKGLNILVATPGRLADHLENTQVLDVSNVRWLVLDEGDRLMELGFEQELQGIIGKLDARQRPSRIPGVAVKRATILCSATLKMTVQKLGEISLKDAVHIKADPADENGENADKDEDAFRVPAQLKQSYAIVASKLRLVSLTAFMKRTFMRKGSVMKAIIFVSCADSVNFHFEVFTRKLQNQTEQAEGQNDEPSEPETPDDKKAAANGTTAPATAFSQPSNPVTMYKLHGSLPQHVRTSTLSSFAKQRHPSVLICTDVASRGLDLPNVDLVVEYDPAFSADEHLHRIGRTARLGRDGRALLFLLPGCEENYVDVLKRGYRDGGKTLSRLTADDMLKRGFGGNVQAHNRDWDDKATEWQLDLERWALENPEYLEMGRRAYQSHIRAYATHIANERHIFNIKELHLGHLAKSFALRDRPGKINVPGLRQAKEDAKKDFKERRAAPAKKRKAPGSGGRDDLDISSAGDAELAAQKMRAKMMQNNLAGASEFNLA
ncbi:P-loop containing nucleoside triphosphate hydrolase protein [Aspergillus cavernicola]|uniref:ATP-dependent RNA helicase n=1 Tax=Aspergillus cavernicola TaxID=176166 RepID=A0ABR4ISV6_9EURO